MAQALNVCTSGRRVRGLTEKHEPCGRVLYLVGYTFKRRLAVEVCPRCDAAESMPAVRDLRAT